MLHFATFGIICFMYFVHVSCKKDTKKLKINKAQCFGNRISPCPEAKSKVKTYLAGCVVSQLVCTLRYKVEVCGFSS